jgi:hypothetical protein
MKKIKNIKKRYFIITICTIIIFLGLLITKISNDEIVAITPDTTIDLTGLVTGNDANHTCIYKTKYDTSYHWQECILCSTVKDKKEHTKVEKWASPGSPTCVSYNRCTTYCSDNCGYSVSYTTSHIPAGNYYQTYQDWYHYRTCGTCGQWCEMVYCTKADGSIITCNNLGTCVGCGHTYTQKNHYITAGGSCTKCGVSLLSSNIESVTYSSDRKTVTVKYRVIPKVTVTDESVAAWSGSGGFSLDSTTYVKNSDGSYTLTIVCKVTTYPYQIDMYIQPVVQEDGEGSTYASSLLDVISTSIFPLRRVELESVITRPIAAFDSPSRLYISADSSFE